LLVWARRLGGKLVSTSSIASIRTIRGRVLSIGWDSGRSSRASDASWLAISTLVGPAPTMAKVVNRARLTGSSQSAARS
jgi:hypothetical protein